MELIDKLKKILVDDYGITSNEELQRALEEQDRIDIGIFVSSCGMTKDEAKAS